MSNSTVMTRKDMKEPDKFQVAAGQAASWVAGHRKGVIAAVVAVAAAAVLAAAVSTWQASRTEQAGAALSEVLRVAGGEITAVPLPGLPGPFFKDEAERNRAVLDAARKVREGFAGSDASTQAALLAGDAHLGLREWDAAVGAYNDYLTNADAKDPMRFGALEGLAVAEEGRGKLDAAAATYERLAKEVPFYADRADFERARILAAQGKEDEARKLLEGFAEKHAKSPLVGEAAERLARMGGK
ncbi:MAG TPA: tetratricopeptide repeat protein [Anaeromyxobacteraceae bacterium]|nr:tetratricopeptide repeat protein [Anaeromyxobacteraceae bacterium]